MQYVTGIDIGTGSAKAVAVNLDGKIIASTQFFYPTYTPQHGYSEQDPEVIWQAFVDCLNEIIKKVGHVPYAVSLSSAMHSLVLMNDKNIAVTPLITWADTRSEKVAEEIRNSTAAEKLYTSTGTPIHSMSPLCKIKWLKENQPEIFSTAFKFISIKEFIWYRLFNEYQVDYSIASATGLFNIVNYQWNTPSLNLCGITASLLSKIVSTGFTRKDLNKSMAALLKIPADTIFCIGASDGCLANVGSDAVEKDIAALTIGTSGAVRITNTKPINNYQAMIFNYVLDKKTFVCGGPINNGGNVLKWLFKTFLQIEKPSETDYESFFKNIETVPAGCKGLLFLPYIYGERAPVWDEKASGIFFGIKSYHTGAHFLRSALEGICFALKNIIEIIENSTTPLKELHVSGGFVHSKIWMQILANVTGKRLCLVQTEDASSVGAAIFCMKAINIIDEYSSIKPNISLIIEPDEEFKKMYEKYYGIFKALYEPLKIPMHRLHNLNNA